MAIATLSLDVVYYLTILNLFAGFSLALMNYSKLSALVVDDFDSFRTTLQRLLNEFGIGSVRMANTGEEALSLCGVHHFDIILCDYNLGTGKNGQQVLEELRIKSLMSSATVFVLISAETSKSIVMSAYDYEPDAYLTKPITGKALQQRLLRLLKQREEMDGFYQCLEEQDVAAAESLAIQAIASGSRHTGTYQKLLGKLYLQQSKFVEAEQLFREVLEVRPLDWAQVGLARVQAHRGNMDTANHWLTQIIDKNPYCMEAYDVLSENLRSLQQLDEEQKVREKSVEMSPLSISRQASLAAVADMNNDQVTAVKALSKAVKLGRNSCLDSVEHQFNFIRSVALLNQQDPISAADYFREVQRSLGECGKRYLLSEEQNLQLKLLDAQVMGQFGDSERASSALQSVQSRMKELTTESTLDLQLDLASSMLQLGQSDQAQVLLKSLVDSHKGDQIALRKIDRFLPEPVSESNISRVKAFNSEGINAYQNNDFATAVNCFEKAQRLFPHHKGVQLNLVQALLGGMSRHGLNDVRMATCRRILAEIKSALDPSDHQFERYQQLDAMYWQLQRSGAN